MTNKPTTPASGGAQEPADDAREALEELERMIASIVDREAFTLDRRGGVVEQPGAKIAREKARSIMRLIDASGLVSALKRSPAESGGAQATAVGEARGPFSTVSPYGEIGRRGSPLAYLIDPGAGSGSDRVTRYWPTRGELDDIERRGGSVTPLYQGAPS